MPAGTPLVIDRDAAWDTVQIRLDGDGRFEFDRIPPETIWIRLRHQDYRIAPETAFFDGGADAVTLEMKHDVEDLRIVLEHR